MRNLLILFLVFVLNFSCKEKPEKRFALNQTVVQDYAMLLSVNERNLLSQKIISYEESTTNEICIFTLDSVSNNKSILYHATMIADSLGVGKRKKNNGLLILISKSDRQTSIATGTGTEKILTDYICKRIIDEAMIPSFKDGQFYKGLDSSLDSIIAKWK